MKKIFIGLLFVFIDINIGRVCVTPSFVGYILIYLGVKEEAECPRAYGFRTLVEASAVVMGILWALNIFGLVLPIPVGVVFQLLVTYHLIRWAREQAEAICRETAYIDKMETAWNVMFFTSIIGVVLSLFVPRLATLLFLATFVAAVCYIYSFYHVWKDLAALPGGVE